MIESISQPGDRTANRPVLAAGEIEGHTESGVVAVDLFCGAGGRSGDLVGLLSEHTLMHPLKIGLIDETLGARLVAEERQAAGFAGAFGLHQVGQDRHGLAEQPGERAEHAADEAQIGEQRRLQVGEHGVEMAQRPERAQGLAAQWQFGRQAILDGVWQEYHDPNEGGLFDIAARHGVKKVVLLSSANVYGPATGNPNFLPEETPLLGAARLAYWEMNGYGFERERAKLGLRPRPPRTPRPCSTPATCAR